MSDEGDARAAGAGLTGGNPPVNGVFFRVTVSAEAPVEYRILGPLEVRDGDREVQLRGGKQQALLALLLVNANRTLPIDVMVGMSTAMMVTVIVGLSVWNGWYGKRAGAEARAWAAEHEVAA